MSHKQCRFSRNICSLLNATQDISSFNCVTYTHASICRVWLTGMCYRYSGSLRSLLNANADYVVDALCGQLRDLGTHPRAPLLLAALLRRAGGVAPHMLPLMAEPLQAALRVCV